MNNFFSKYRFIFYTANISLVILYLYPGSLLGCFFFNDCKIQPQITADFIISSNHVYAFATLCFIGIFTYKKSNKVSFLVVYLIFLSLILEMFHFLIPDRSFEFLDVLGNLFGVFVPLVIYFFYKKYENFKN